MKEEDIKALADTAVAMGCDGDYREGYEDGLRMAMRLCQKD